MLRYVLRQPAPAFEDPDLSIPLRVHRDRCRALSGSRPCDCGSGGWELPAGKVTLLREDRLRLSAQVQAVGYAPVWVEAEVIGTERRSEWPEVSTRETHAPDHRALLAWQTTHGRPHYGRRRRVPQIGELVWIRSELRDEQSDLICWRLIYSGLLEGRKTVVLAAPGRPAVDLMGLGWDDVRYLQADDDPMASLLVPVFPLPDGTGDLGWDGAGMVE